MERNCVIIDLDGTLCDTRHRLHFLQSEPRNWNGFFDACKDDTPHDYVLALAQLIWSTARYALVLCSGRPDSHMNDTLDWLKKHHVGFDELLMRKTGDFRPDHVIKKEMLARLRDQNYRPLFAVDDRPEVITMWRDNGVPCLVVEQEDWTRQVWEEGARAMLAIAEKRQPHFYGPSENQTIKKMRDDMRAAIAAGPQPQEQASHAQTTTRTKGTEAQSGTA